MVEIIQELNNTSANRVFAYSVVSIIIVAIIADGISKAVKKP